MAAPKPSSYFNLPETNTPEQNAEVRKKLLKLTVQECVQIVIEWAMNEDVEKIRGLMQSGGGKGPKFGICTEAAADLKRGYYAALISVPDSVHYLEILNTLTAASQWYRERGEDKKPIYSTVFNMPIIHGAMEEELKCRQKQEKPKKLSKAKAQDADVDDSSEETKSSRQPKQSNKLLNLLLAYFKKLYPLPVSGRGAGVADKELKQLRTLDMQIFKTEKALEAKEAKLKENSDDEKLKAEVTQITKALAQLKKSLEAYKKQIEEKNKLQKEMDAMLDCLREAEDGGAGASESVDEEDGDGDGDAEGDDSNDDEE